MSYNSFSQSITVFHGRTFPEPGLVVGYGNLIDTYHLSVPIPDKIALISKKHKKYTTDEWNVFTPRHNPEHSLAGHLTFALKYEGIDLIVLKAIFSSVSSNEIKDLIEAMPISYYGRRIWFLYEWLMDEKLDIPDLKTGNYVDVLDEKLQYPGASHNSPRHRVRNNLPGVKDFCPLIRKTETLKGYIRAGLDKEIEKSLDPIRRDVLMRAVAFLMLKDSKASYAIEGESPAQNRLQRWGQAIGQAGRNNLSKKELLRLQAILIEDQRFIKLGWRDQDGFVGVHDREFGTPIPEHISAKWQDIDALIDGLLATNEILKKSNFDAVLAATVIAFGFVLIHPFVDGNGRIHRYLIHHVLTKMGFADGNIVFPISSAILEKVNDYAKVLAEFSQPRLELIKWETTSDNNVSVINETIDLYKYFDATKMAEFLYDCVEKTIFEIIPTELEYLHNYDEFKHAVDQQFDMPDKMIALLLKFLSQGNGKLSKRTRDKEFSQLTEDEITNIEDLYTDIFHNK